jgi:hypothetical protein
MDIFITVPEEYVAASNGLLQEVIDNGDDTRTYHWFESYPIATYLVTMNVYPYFVWSDEYVSANSDTMPIIFYTMFDTADAGSYLVENYLKTKDMITLFAGQFGEYPFIEEKYGHAEALPATANMEHQTLSLMVNYSENIIAHELGHQWWGDMISPSSFHHMWLNEGFASYSEVLWDEYAYGPEGYFQHISADAYKGGGTVYVYDLYAGNLWDFNLRYRKGSFIMHMLRGVLGDEDFFESLQVYGAHPDYKYASATTEQFQAVCEDISGLDLERFFDQWIYGEYFPIYEYDWRIRPGDEGSTVELVVNQVQTNTGLFSMPIDIVVDTETASETYVVWDSLATQYLSFDMADTPANLAFDPEEWILREAGRVAEFTPRAAIAGVNQTFLRPGLDYLVVTAEAQNPDDHTVSMSAIVEPGDEQHLPQVTLQDDGNGSDEIAGDGVFTGSWAVPPGEYFYNVDIMTTSLDSNYSVIDDDLTYFTTAGPLVYGGITDMTSATVAPGGQVWFTLAITNHSQALTAEFVQAELRSMDTNFVADNMGYITFDEIEAGETADMVSGSFRVTIGDLPDGQLSVPLELDIYSGGVLYWRDSFDLDITVVNVADAGKLPSSYDLIQNYPNPFNPITTISYALPQTAEVAMNIYSVTGQLVRSLSHLATHPGRHSVVWDGCDDSGNLVSTGVYLCRLEAGDFTKSIKMVYLR